MVFFGFYENCDVFSLGEACVVFVVFTMVETSLKTRNICNFLFLNDVGLLGVRGDLPMNYLDVGTWNETAAFLQTIIDFGNLGVERSKMITIPRK